MEITKISLLEKKSLSNDRIYFKVKIVWDKIEEIVELWGIEDNILVTKEYRPDIEKIISHSFELSNNLIMSCGQLLKK